MKYLLTQNTMTLRTGFLYILGQIGGLSEMKSCIKLAGCHFGPGWSTHMWVAPLGLFTTLFKIGYHQIKAAISNYNNISPKWGNLKILIITLFWVKSVQTHDACLLTLIRMAACQSQTNGQIWQTKNFFRDFL